MVAHHGIRTNPSHGIPSAFNLPTLYQFVSGMTPELSHRALADVKATATIFRFEIFWEVWKECIFVFQRLEGEGTVQPVDVLQQPVNDDSDTCATVIWFNHSWGHIVLFMWIVSTPHWSCSSRWKKNSI